MNYQAKEYIPYDNRDRIVGALKRLRQFYPVVTVKDYLTELNNMYILYGVDIKEPPIKIEYIKELDTIINLNDIRATKKTLTRLLHNETLTNRRHYIYKVLGVMYELAFGDKYKNLNETTKEMDLIGKWDFVDDVNKILVQVKYATTLGDNRKYVKNMVEWANNNGYEEYTGFIHWYDHKNDEVKDIKIKDAKSAGEQNV